MCVFLGYPLGCKGYKLYDLESQSTFISRDVHFYENVFPYRNQSTASTSSPSHKYIPLPHIAIPPSPTLLDDTTPIPPPSPPSTHTLDPLPHDSPPHSSSLSSLPSSTASPPPSSLPIRRGTRVRHPPSYLQDYHTSLATISSSCPPTPPLSPPPTCTDHPLCSVLNYSHLSVPYKSFVLSISSHPLDPLTYQEAVQFAHWRFAKASELAALHENATWDIVPLPSHHQPVGCKWVYKTKFKENGDLTNTKLGLLPRVTPNVQALITRRLLVQLLN